MSGPEWAALAAIVITAAAWPGVVLFVFLMFRRELAEFIARKIKHGRG